MPRIPETEIERLKRSTDLAALVRSRGVELKRHGGNGHLAGKCPFHGEDEARWRDIPLKWDKFAGKSFLKLRKCES